MALSAGGIGLLVGVGLLSVGEVRSWAARRRVPRPLGFTLWTWSVSSALWIAYALAVSLPLALLTDLPDDKGGRDLLALLTFLPYPLAYLATLAFAYHRELDRALARLAQRR